MESIYETSFPDVVKAVKFNSRRVLALTETVIYIYDSASMCALHTIRTVPNLHGIVALSSDPNNCLLLYPKSTVEGCVIVYDCLQLQLIGSFRAHHHRLAQISIAPGGHLAASASARGTIIRVFSLPDMQKLFTFKRGSHTAFIYDISFIPELPYLVATSNTGTIHVFVLDQNVGAKSQHWSSYILTTLTHVMPADSIDTTRSVVKLSLPHKHYNIATFVSGHIVSFSYAGGEEVFKVEVV
mmetsp:Transcript_32915/g.57575  ORF Transcript_32915/g.57575 Transcript_32915/m.57575 type:complete len:241 (+) Transcript_32915:12394-13116(+)